MDLLLTRTMWRPDGIFGELCDENGACLWFTLEHAYPSAGEIYLPKLPPGIYTCVRGEHKLHEGKPFETFEIMGIDGHDGILFHQGNYNENSEGCVLLGKGMGYKMGGKIKMITYSKQGFEEFFKIQKECDEFELTVD